MMNNYSDERALTKDHPCKRQKTIPIKDHTDKRLPWYKTILILPWYKTTLIKDHTDKRQPWCKTTLVKDHPNKIATLMKDHTNKRQPWWMTTLIKQPPWWKIAFFQDLFCWIFWVDLKEGVQDNWFLTSGQPCMAGLKEVHSAAINNTFLFQSIVTKLNWNVCV